MKRCFKCGIEKPLDDFYVHPQMLDGHLDKCKECTKNDAHIRERLHGKEIYLKEQSNLSEKQKQQRQQAQERRRAKHPEKYKARTMVANAVRDGRLIKQPCIKCGNLKVQAHHADYSKPLDVVWECRKCHLEEHGKIAYDL
jgi:ribosomal protein S27AE